MADKKHGIDKDLIRELAELLKETELSEIEIEQDDFRVRVSRSIAAPTHVLQAEAPRAAPRQAPSEPESAGVTDPAKHPGCLPSPMVGTAYLSPEPGARSFVEVGDSVKVGQTLLIIEAMKHMNEVSAPRAGKVTAILVNDAQPVEYGEPLMIIE